MGCLVEKTDTGVEVDVHIFNTWADAVHFLREHKGYSFDKHESWGMTSGFDFFQGPLVNQRAALREKDGYYRVAFWEK